MTRTVLQDVDRVMSSGWYRAWALVHQLDAAKIKLEREGKRRPLSQDAWARTFIEAIRVGHAAAPPPPPPPPPDPPPPDPPPPPRLAPMTHYAAPGADARFCVRSPGVTNTGVGDHPFVDEGGFRYTENGMCAGGRSGKFVAVLKPANSMDGMEPCDGYTKDGRRFPPWPPESYEV